jgi:hypothetical protein
MRKLITGAIAAATLLIPAASMAHDYVSSTTCTSSAPGLAHDCVRVDTDTEFEDGVIVTLDGDDSNPRGDDTSDGYVAVELTSDGATVYCEDEGGFNHIPDRDGGDEDDANGENEVCEL